MLDQLRWQQRRDGKAHPVGGGGDSGPVFRALVDAHYRRVYVLAYRILRSEADAADVTQEVFCRVYRSLPRLRADGAQASWIRRIATNLCLDHLRRRKTTPQTVSLDASLACSAAWEAGHASEEPERVLAASERREVLYKAIAALPEDYRLVLVMHHLEEMGVEEIAEALGVPAGTIKSRLSRARKILRRRLAPYFDPNCLVPA